MAPSQAAVNEFHLLHPPLTPSSNQVQQTLYLTSLTWCSCSVAIDKLQAAVTCHQDHCTQLPNRSLPSQPPPYAPHSLNLYLKERV